tara:strand:- start:232 stop:462 length:231 start_codon:yes stop_codon:yes gene_type:complete
MLIRSEEDEVEIEELTSLVCWWVGEVRFVGFDGRFEEYIDSTLELVLWDTGRVKDRFCCIVGFNGLFESSGTHNII